MPNLLEKVSDEIKLSYEVLNLIAEMIDLKINGNLQVLSLNVLKNNFQVWLLRQPYFSLYAS